MDRETRRLVDEFSRSDASPIENNLIDELVAGELDRQEFLRRAAVFGLGAGTIGLLFAISASPSRRSARRSPPAKVGGTLRVGSVAYGRSLEPYQTAARQVRSDLRGFQASTSPGRTTSSS